MHLIICIKADAVARMQRTDTPPPSRRNYWLARAPSREARDSALRLNRDRGLIKIDQFNFFKIRIF